MSNPNNHAGFEAADQDALSQLVEDPSELVNADTGAPSTTDTPANSPAPAPAAAVANAPASATANAPAPAANPASTETAAPAGDLRGALRASRRGEHRANEMAAKLAEENRLKDQMIADLRAGKSVTMPVAETSEFADYTDEELAEMEQDFPLQAKMARNQRVINERLKTAAPDPARQVSDEFIPPTYAPEVQELIDTVPDLMTWQFDAKQQDKFQAAIQYDNALRIDPDWKTRTAAERFTEAARRVNASAAASPASNRIDPAQALKDAQMNGPAGISDFRGGAPGHTPSPVYARLSDEQIMQSLTPEG